MIDKKNENQKKSEIKFACTYGVVSALGFEDGLKRIAEAGYEGVELNGNQFVMTEDQTPMDQCRPLTSREVDLSAAKFAEAGKFVEELGLQTIAMTFSWFWVGRFELEAMENYFRLAKAAGASALKVAGVLIGSNRFSNYWTALENALKQMDIVCGFAEKHGVRALIELHDGYLHESASQARRFCEPFDHRWLGVIHDPENMVRSGKEHWPHSIDILGDYLAYIHWKNMGLKYNEETKKWEKFPATLDKGLVQWSEIVETLWKRGFNGYLANENYPLEDINVVENDLAYMKKIISELENERAE